MTPARIPVAALVGLLLVPSVLAATRRVAGSSRPPSASRGVSLQAEFVADLERRMEAASSPEEAVQELRLAYGRTRNPELRLRLLRVLDRHPGPAAEGFLADVLRLSPNAALRERSAQVLGRIGQEAGEVALVRAAASDPVTAYFAGGCRIRQRHIRLTASRALEELRHRRGAAADERMASSADDEVVSSGREEARPPGWLR